MFDIDPGLINEVIRYDADNLLNFKAILALRDRLSTKENSACLVLCYSGQSLLSRIKRILLCILLGIPFPFGLTSSRVLPFQRLLNRWRVDRLDIKHQYTAALDSTNELLVKYNLFKYQETTYYQFNRSTQKKCSLIGIAPFSKQPVKQWPLQRFAELMVLLEKHTGAHFEVYGASEEIEMAQQLEKFLNKRVYATFLCGALTPFQLRQRLEAVDLLICLDSGPMHLASLVGTPLVAIFSQITLHQLWRPWGPRGLMVSKEVDCAVCNTHTGKCPRGTRTCIDGISLDSVLEQARLLLRSC